VITREMVAAAMEGRPRRRLVMLDLAVPRDVDPAAAEIPGVSLRNLDDLRDAVAPGADQMGEVERVRAIVAEETPRFAAWQRAHHLAPLIAALQERAERVRTAELRRASARLSRLSEREREAVEQLTRSMVAKLLHHPVTRVKAGAGTTEGETLARALRDLFELGGD
jgi:glutamyl-tRNA reductase